MSLDLIDGIKWCSPTVWFLLHARRKEKKRERKKYFHWFIAFSFHWIKKEWKSEKESEMTCIVATHTTRSSHTLVVQKWNIILINQNRRKVKLRRWTIANKRRSQTVRKKLIHIYFYLARSIMNSGCLSKSI